MGGPWFAHKRFGLGAGLPIAWQGWAVLLIGLGAFAAVMALTAGFVRPLASLGILLVIVVIAAAKTDGGWKWRWGE